MESLTLEKEKIQITKRKVDSNASYKRHHAILREKIEEILNNNDFKNTELELILEFIKNVDAFEKVFGIISSFKK